MLKLIFLQTSLIYSEFPVSKNINNVIFLPKQQVLTEIQTIATKTLQQRHSQLRKQITSTEENDKRNYFACCFVFKLPKNQEIEVPLLYEFIVNSGMFELTIPKSTIEALTVKLQQTNNITFVSHQPNHKVYTGVRTLHKLFLDSVQQDNAAAKNQAMLLKAIYERSIDLKGNIKYDVSSALRSTDSEAGAIYVLQKKYVIDNIIEKIREYLGSITSIEFHGCTTRDMCALCFTNMNIIQYLSNNNGSSDFSFLRYLKQTIEATQQTSCPTKIFISSFQPSIGNLNFNSANLASNYNDNCVYQFRIDPLCQ